MIEKIPVKCSVCDSCYYNTEPYLKAGYTQEQILYMIKQGMILCLYGGPFSGYRKVQ